MTVKVFFRFKDSSFRWEIKYWWKHICSSQTGRSRFLHFRTSVRLPLVFSSTNLEIQLNSPSQFHAFFWILCPENALGDGNPLWILFPADKGSNCQSTLGYFLPNIILEPQISSVQVQTIHSYQSIQQK